MVDFKNGIADTYNQRGAGMAPFLLLVISAAALCGCTSQEIYATGQGWQRQECLKIMDNQDRSRCIASTSRSYEDYRREAEAGKTGK